METEEFTEKLQNRANKITKRNYDDEQKTTNFVCFVDSARKLLKSHKLHVAIVILIIIDCLCVAAELIISDIERHLEEPESLIIPSINLNKHGNNSNSVTEGQHVMPHVILRTLESIFKFTSLTILGLFTVEVIVKLLLIPREIFSSIWEIVDSIVVVLSFGLNIFLVVSHIHNAAGLLVLLRLWRIVEIINGSKFLYSYFI